MAKNKNLVNLAKKAHIATKSDEEILESKNLDKDEKAKMMAEKIINEVDVEVNKDENDLLIIDEERANHTEWLSNQVESLRKENEELKNKLEEFSASDETLTEKQKALLIAFFKKQYNILHGKDQYPVPYHDMSIEKVFLPNMVKIFPFLNKYMR